jgi:hypothetical protein
MSTGRYYRGGPSLVPRPIDVAVDAATGLLRPDRGVSVESVPDGLERFGGAFEVTQVPPSLHFVKQGRRPTHFELAPAYPMTRDEYEAALSQVVLVPVPPAEKDDGSTS